METSPLTPIAMQSAASLLMTSSSSSGAVKPVYPPSTSQYFMNLQKEVEGKEKGDKFLLTFFSSRRPTWGNLVVHTEPRLRLRSALWDFPPQSAGLWPGSQPRWTSACQVGQFYFGVLLCVIFMRNITPAPSRLLTFSFLTKPRQNFWSNSV